MYNFWVQIVSNATCMSRIIRHSQKVYMCPIGELTVLLSLLGTIYLHSRHPVRGHFGKGDGSVFEPVAQLCEHHPDTYSRREDQAGEAIQGNENDTQPHEGTHSVLVIPESIDGYSRRLKAQKGPLTTLTPEFILLSDKQICLGRLTVQPSDLLSLSNIKRSRGMRKCSGVLLVSY